MDRHGRVVARVHFDPERSDTSTVRRAAALAATELDNTRLRAELHRRVDEIAASRARLAGAQRTERRRIERDLHDGAQQRLLALAMELQSARLNGDPERMQQALADGADSAQVAVRELRALANGLHPAALEDGGLPAALDDLARLSTVPLRVSAPVGRLDRTLEFTAWSVIGEAVVNAQKHAGASAIDVDVARRNGHLRLSVRDDGRGGANPDGPGLRGLRDRVETARGELSVSSGTGRHHGRGGAAVRVVIADDSALLRDGLANLLTEAGVDVVARAADAHQLVAMVEEHAPDVAVVDIRMPPTYTHEGAKAALELRQRHPDLGILLLSQSLESRYVTDLARTHARGFGYLLKDRVIDVKVLLDALGSVAAGGTVLDPEVVSHLLGRNELADQLARLSDRERGVLELMAQGLSNRAIAERLVIELKTVETHIARILTKLDLHQTPDEHRRVLAVLAWLRG